MPKFIQLHFLTAYPPSNPNRDDLGQPKTAIVGGATRLRISSQALKRAARLSPLMQNALKGNLGTRTQRIGEIVAAEFEKSELKAEEKENAINAIMRIFGTPKKGDKSRLTEELAFISPDEKKLALEFARKIADGKELPKDKDLDKKQFLLTADGAVDIAMFGRMLAGSPAFNRDAAVQVSHAFTTHKTEVENDYFTAADDLKTAAHDAGAAFLDEASFGSGLYYTYVCIDRDLLVANLEGDRELAQKGCTAFAQAMAQTAPSGKQNSFANRVRAAYVRAEAGDHQPRSLADAFFNPVSNTGNIALQSIEALQDCAERMDHAYDCAPADTREMNVISGNGTMVDIFGLIERAFEGA